jgi:hypothetical protein
MTSLPLAAGEFSLPHAIAFREQLMDMLDGYHSRQAFGGGPGSKVAERIGALTYAIRLIEDQIRAHAPDRAHVMGLFDGIVERGGLFDRAWRQPESVVGRTAEEEDYDAAVVETMAELGIDLLEKKTA